MADEETSRVLESTLAALAQRRANLVQELRSFRGMDGTSTVLPAPLSVSAPGFASSHKRGGHVATAGEQVFPEGRKKKDVFDALPPEYLHLFPSTQQARDEEEKTEILRRQTEAASRVQTLAALVFHICMAQMNAGHSERCSVLHYAIWKASRTLQSVESQERSEVVRALRTKRRKAREMETQTSILAHYLQHEARRYPEQEHQQEAQKEATSKESPSRFVPSAFRSAEYSPPRLPVEFEGEHSDSDAEMDTWLQRM